jgi:hypothetical protein
MKNETTRSKIIEEIGSMENIMDEINLAQYRKNEIWALIGKAYTLGRLASENGAKAEDHQENLFRILANKTVR